MSLRVSSLPLSRRERGLGGKGRRVSILALLSALALLLCGGCGKDPGIPVIASGSEYTDNLNKAEELSKDALEKFEKGETLTEADNKKLGEAMILFKALVAFQPEGFG